MFEDTHFLKETVVEISAAVIGISKNRWIGIDLTCTDEMAVEAMKTHRFDVLPITGDSGVKEYYLADKWNDYSTISRKTLTYRDVIPYQSHIRDVVRRFVLESRTFYFLSNEFRIVGLVSIANLNCKQV